MSLKVLSANVRGLGNNNKRRMLFNLFRKEKYDIICIQEAHVTEKNVQLWKQQWNGQLFFSSGSAHSKGQIILINKKANATNIEVLCNHARILGVKLCYNEQAICIFNVYGPSNDQERKDFFELLCNHYGHLKNQNIPVLFAGDYNVVADNALDIISGNSPAQYSKHCFVQGCSK